MKTLVAFLAMQAIALGQLVVADKYQPYDPVVAGCNCIVPQDGQVQFIWQVDQASKAVAADDGKKLYIWAPPGPHNVEALAIVTQELQILVRDPEDPKKTVEKTIRIFVSFDRYSKSYLVEGSSPGPVPGPMPPPPGPGPGPGPTPGPLPTDDFAKLLLTYLKAVPPANYSKDKATAVADAYESVAAQAVATSGFDLNAFVSQTKAKVQQKLTTADIQAWSVPFFNPLSQQHAKMFNERSLTTTDVQGIAKLWKDTAAAIRSAVLATHGGTKMISPLTPEQEPRRFPIRNIPNG